MTIYIYNSRLCPDITSRSHSQCTNGINFCEAKTGEDPGIFRDNIFKCFLTEFPWGRINTSFFPGVKRLEIGLVL